MLQLEILIQNIALLSIYTFIQFLQEKAGQIAVWYLNWSIIQRYKYVPKSISIKITKPNYQGCVETCEVTKATTCLSELSNQMGLDSLPPISLTPHLYLVWELELQHAATTTKLFYTQSRNSQRLNIHMFFNAQWSFKHSTNKLSWLPSTIHSHKPTTRNKTTIEKEKNPVFVYFSLRFQWSQTRLRNVTCPFSNKVWAACENNEDSLNLS